jgi:hypothetical protein
MYFLLFQLDVRLSSSYFAAERESTFPSLSFPIRDAPSFI